jgi:hypothetical protein
VNGKKGGGHLGLDRQRELRTGPVNPERLASLFELSTIYFVAQHFRLTSIGPDERTARFPSLCPGNQGRSANSSGKPAGQGVSFSELVQGATADHRLEFRNRGPKHLPRFSHGSDYRGI